MSSVPAVKAGWNLPPEHRWALERHAERWRELQRGAGPTDRVAAEDALRELYLRAGLQEPESFYWFVSPTEMLRTLASPSFRSANGANVWHSIGGLLGARAW